jgi:hypothetical protein
MSIGSSPQTGPLLSDRSISPMSLSSSRSSSPTKFISSSSSSSPTFLTPVDIQIPKAVYPTKPNTPKSSSTPAPFNRSNSLTTPPKKKTPHNRRKTVTDIQLTFKQLATIKEKEEEVTQAVDKYLENLEIVTQIYEEKSEILELTKKTHGVAQPIQKRKPSK